MGTLARLVQWHRAPAACALPWRDASVPLPRDLRQVLQAANGDLTALTLGAAEAGCAAAEVRAAALHFVREVLLAPGADHYRRLGVAPEAAAEEIRGNYRELISIFHPDRGADGGDAALAAAVNEAYNTLKRAGARAKYDRTRATVKAEAPAPVVPRVEPADKAGKPKPRWHAQRSSGRAMVWLQSQPPARLKALAFGGLLGGALLAVLIAGSRPSPTMLAIDAGDAPAPASLPAAMPVLRLAQASHAAAAPGNAHPASARADAPAPTHPRSSNPARDAASVAAATAAAYTAGTVRASLAHAPEVATSRETADVAPARRDVPPLADEQRTEPATIRAQEMSVAAASPPAQRAPAVESRPAPSVADLELLVARFAAAYDNGDLPALTALVDPDAAQGERMVATLASYGRVFQASTRRRLDLRVVDMDAAHGRIELAMRTALTDAANVQRTSTGTLTLTVRLRGTAVVITDLACREVDAA